MRDCAWFVCPTVRPAKARLAMLVLMKLCNIFSVMATPVDMIAGERLQIDIPNTTGPYLALEIV